LSSFALSPEGARVAVSVATKSGSKVLLYGIERSKTGEPIAFSAPILLRTDANRITSLSWLDGMHLGLIVQTATGWSQPSEIAIGGFEQPVTGMDNLIQFVGNNATEARYALTKSGNLMRYRSSTWSVIQPNVKRVHFAN
jgi:hypothetical protein